MEWNWWVLAAVLPAWFLQLCIHELSHLLVGWFHEGKKPEGFYPYPHKHEGRFYFARYAAGPSKFPDSFYVMNHLPRHIAPFVAGVLVLAISLVVFFLLSPAWRVWVLPTAAMGLGDALWFWRGYFWGSKRTDGMRWRYGDAYCFDSGLADKIPLNSIR
jgi:hypothetical protein